MKRKTTRREHNTYNTKNKQHENTQANNHKKKEQTL